MKIQKKILYKIGNKEVEYFIFKPSKKVKNTILITGGIHGLEIVGSEALLLLKQYLIKNNFPFNIILIPCVNIVGAINNERTLNNIDINRSFPGNPEGNSAEKIAFVLSLLIEQSDILIDVHSAGNCIPFIIIDKLAKTNKISKWAKSSGVLVLDEIHEYLEDGQDLYNTFSWFANKNGKITLTLELKGSNVITEKDTIMNFTIILNLLKNIQLIGEVDEPLLTKMEFKSPTSGYFKAIAKPGDKLNKGDKIGEITGLGGSVIREIVADENCILIKLPDNNFTDANAVLGFIAKDMV